MGLPTIQIKDIPEEGLELESTLDDAWLREVLKDTGYEPSGVGVVGRAKVRLDPQGRDVLLTGFVEAKMRCQCVRCLEPVLASVRAEFTLNLEPAPKSLRKSRGPEVELTSDELDVDYFEDDKIELSRWIREQVLLEAPAYPSCEPTCLAPLALPKTESSATEGSESTPRDPRFAVLSKLLKKE